MLGICAELLLDGLKELVSHAVTKGLETTRNYIYLYTLEATRDDTTRPNTYQHKGDVTWDLINQVAPVEIRAEELKRKSKRRNDNCLRLFRQPWARSSTEVRTTIITTIRTTRRRLASLIGTVVLPMSQTLSMSLIYTTR